MKFNLRKRLSAFVTFTLTLGLVGGALLNPARAAATALNDNTDVFQISFTGLTSMTSLANKALLNPNNLQVQWSLNPTYNATTKNYDVGTDWINITSVNNTLTTSFVPTSGSGPNGTVAALSPIVSTDIVVMTIRANPLNAASASLGGYLGKQSTAGLRTASTLGSHLSGSTNPYDKELLSFGSFTGFAVLEDAFSGVPSTFTMSAKLPATVTNLSYAFGNQSATQYYNASEITLWDTSNVTNMSGMFYKNLVFNQNLSNWNTSNVTTMANMFYSAIAFNNGLARGVSGTLAWNTASVTDMTAMFYNTNSFNQQIDSWNTGQVTNMYMMFQVANRFNQNLNSWDVSRVTNMSYMFTNATIFNGNISAWNTANVTNMAGMFNGALAFNQAVGSWNVAKVTTMISMFNGATSFNQNLNSWQVSQVTSLSNMFNGATSFNNGNASGVIGDMTWTMSNTVTSMASMFKGATAFNQNLTTWNTSNVTDMSEVFRQASKFNGTVNGWDTAKATTLTRTFYGATVFNQPVSNWNVSSVVNFEAMFQSAVAFNQNLNSWTPSSANYLNYMFYSATNFNNGLPSGTSGSMTWSNLKRVTTFSDMFYGATSFNQNLNSWVMDRGVTSYKNMFYGATSFNNGNTSAMTWTLVYRIPLSTVDSPATDMTSMFQGASAFNQNLNSWNVSFVSVMPNMFQNASSFNNGLPAGVSGSMAWTMAGSTSDISGMFQNATSFNQSMSTWVTTGTSKFYNLLTGATSFNQNLASFDIVSWQNASSITFPASMSSANVQATIKSWAWQSRAPSIGIYLDSTHTVYSDCASYNAFLQFTGGSYILNGIKPTAPTCANTAALTWSPDTAIVAPTVVNGINQASSNLYSFTPSALPTGGNDYLYATRTATCQVDANTGVVIYRGGTTSCSIRVVDPTITGAGTTSGSFVDVTFSLTTYTKPGSPTAASASIVDGSTVRVSWTAPTATGGTSLVSYTAYFAAASAPSNYIEGCSVNAPTTTCDITGLTTGTSYTFKVVAWNGIAYSLLEGATATASLVPDVAPGAPTITSIEPGGAGNQIVISYTAGTNSGSAITGYEYSTNNGKNWKAAPTVTSTSITIDQESGSTNEQLAYGSTYTIKILAKNSMSGAESNAMTGYPEMRKNAPTINSITGSFSTLTVAFTAPTGPAGGNAITTYEYSTDAGQTWKQRETGTTGTSLVISTLSSSSAALVTATTYPVQIRAKNLLSGLASTTTNGTTDIAPGAPTLGATITGGFGQLSVPFTAGTNTGTSITKYQYSTDNGTTWADRTDGGTTGTPILITTQSNGSALVTPNTYQVKIRAFNSIAGIASTAKSGITEDVAPGAPTNLVATPGDQQISVAFTAGTNSGSSITKYEYSIDGGSTWAVATGTSSPVSISGLTNGTAYTVRLRAFNSAAGSASNAATAVTPNVSLAAPTSVTATLSGLNATISWTAPTGNVSSYTVTSDSGSFTCSTSSASYLAATSCTISNLVAGNTYRFSVTATNNIGTSSSSSFSNSVTTPTVPDSPVSVSASSTGNSATITWTDGGGASATSYSATSTPSGFDCTVAAPSSSCTVTGLTFGTSYSWVVVASNASGSSGSSTASNSITPDVAPGAPTISSISIGNAQLSVSFTAGTNSGTSITKYQYSTDGTNWIDASGTTSPLTLTTQSSAGTPALVNGTSYSIRIRAFNTVAGTASTSVLSTPDIAPGAPTITAITPSDRQLSVAFTAGSNSGSNITKYQYSTDNGLNWTDATGTTSPLVITSDSTSARSRLTNGAPYYVKIRAVNTTSGTASNTVIEEPDIQIGAPTIVSIDPADRSFTLYFLAGTDNGGSGLSKYEYSTDGGVTWLMNVDLTSPMTLVLSSDRQTYLENGTSYDIRLRAYNTMSGLESSVVSNNVPNIPPGAPSITSITPGNTQLSVAFTAGTNTGTAITKYQYTTDGSSWRDLSGTTSPFTISTISGAAASSLVNGTSYNIRLRAFNTLAGTASSSTSGIPDVAPGAPTISSITQGDGQLSVAFSAGTNSGSTITKYQYSTDGGSTWRDRASGTTASPLVITTTSDTNTTLVNGTSYDVQIRAFNTLAGTASSTSAATPDSGPDAPTIDSITPGNAQLSVAFTAGTNSGSTITKYQYSTDGGSTWRDRASGTTASPLVITTTSDTNTTLVNGTSYDVQIRAFNSMLGTASATTVGTPDVAPGAPVTSGTYSYDKELRLAFTAGTNSGSTITKYQYSTDNGATWNDASGTSSPIVITTTSNTNTTLVNGTYYDLKLRAFNTLPGATSTGNNHVAPDIKPGTPFSLVATPGDKQLTIAYSRSLSGSSVTAVYYSTDDGATFRIATGIASPIVITRTSDSSNALLTNGTTYRVKIYQFNTMSGTVSSAVSGTPDIAPGAPTIDSITPGNGQLSVAFTAGANTGSAITKYQYTSDGSTWKDLSGTTSPFTISTISAAAATSLVNGTPYSIRLRAFNTQAGTSSTSVSGIPDIGPDAPTINSITTSDSQLSVAFTAGTNSGSTITKYQYSTDGGSTWRDRTTGTTGSPLVIATTSDTNTSLVNGSIYSVKIRAFNTLSGTASSSTSATPDITPGAVTNLSGTSADAQVPLTWTAPSGSPITNYLIEYSSNGVTYSTFSHTASTSTSITVTGLTNGTAYTFRVSAINGTSIGESTISGAITPRANQAALNWGTFSTSVDYLGTLTLSTTGGSGAGAVVYTTSASSTCAIASNILTAGDAGSVCVITATKQSDGAYNPISTTALTITVAKIAQANNLSFTNATTVEYGNTLTINAVGGSGGGAMGYTISSAGTTGCSINSSTGVLTVSAAGTCRVAAQRASSTNYQASSTATQDITVTKAAQTISFTSTIPTTPLAGDTYNVSATSTAGLTVTFSITSGSCTANAGVVTFNASGSCVIKASQIGSGQYLAASDIYQTIAVGQRNQVLNFTPSTLAITTVYFDATAFAIQATSSEATAVITYAIGAATTNTSCSITAEGLVSINAVGLCQVKADSASTAEFAAASTILHSFNVLPALASAPFITSIGGGNQAITINFTPPSYNGGSSISGYQLAAVPQSGSSPTLYESGCSTTTTNGEATCTIRGLSNGVTYKTKVAAITAAGVGTYSDLSASLLIATNPSAVQALRVTQLNASLIINWNDPDSLGGGTFSEYRIFIKPSANADYNQMEYFAVTNNSLYQYTATKVSPTGAVLVNGNAYDIKVVTVTTANSSELTANTAVVNQIPRTVPDAPVFDDALIVGTEVVLTWQTPVSDGGSPVVSYDANLGSQTCNFVQATDTFCSVPVPTVGGSFTYEVKAVNAAGSSEPATGRIQIGTAPADTSVANLTTGTTSGGLIIGLYKTKKNAPATLGSEPAPSPSILSDSSNSADGMEPSEPKNSFNPYPALGVALVSFVGVTFILLFTRRRKKQGNQQQIAIVGH